MEKSITQIALFAALTTVLFVLPSFPLAVGVPISFTSLGIMLCGTILGAKRGALAAALFVILLALGVPNMFGAPSGLGLFVGPRAGFLIGFPIAAFVIGWVFARMKASIGLSAFVASLLGGIVVLYAIGIPVMAAMMTDEGAAKTLGGLAFHQSLPLPLGLAMLFVPGDIIKAVLAALITGAIARMRPDALLSRQ